MNIRYAASVVVVALSLFGCSGASDLVREGERASGLDGTSQEPASPAPTTEPSVCPSRETVCEIAGGQQKKSVPATTTAPSTWKALPGSETSKSSIDWLYGHASDTSALGKGVCSFVGCFTDFLDGKMQGIVDKCKAKTTDAEKILCAGAEVRAFMEKDDSYVCRHHAIAMWWVLDKLGLKAGLQCSSTHAWVETQVDGKRVLVDAYNGIYIVID